MKNLLTNYIQDDVLPPFVLITCGLPATLKSTLARFIAEEKGCCLLSTDAIRRDVLAGENIFDESIASDINKRSRVYDELFRRAAAEKSQCLVLDATFILQSMRRQAAEIAAARQAQFIIIETVCPRDAALERIMNRDRATSESNAITRAAYLDNELRFEPVDILTLSVGLPDIPFTHVTVDTYDFSPSAWTIVNIVTCGRSS